MTFRVKCKLKWLKGYSFKISILFFSKIQVNKNMPWNLIKLCYIEEDLYEIMEEYFSILVTNTLFPNPCSN